MTEGPTEHQLWAAVRVARMIDAGGNELDDVRHSYARAVTFGEFPVDHLQAGEQLLLQARLVEIVDGRLRLAPALEPLIGLSDAEAVAVLAQVLAWWGTAGDDLDVRAQLGAAGEEHVAGACREELRELGRGDLAAQVQRVSLVTDAAGYDVYAPVIAGSGRRLEVKTCRPGTSVRFFLTRHEWEVGRRDPDGWALVVCGATGAIGSDLVVEVLGWCRAESLQVYLPEDRNGRWTEALVRLPRPLLTVGLPPPV